MEIFNPSFDFCNLADVDIIALLKKENLALTIEEAKKIQLLLERTPTLAECILWSIQASEHCSYKSTRKHLKILPTQAPNVILGPQEDAGVVEIARDNQGYRYGVVMSHESHNHPSQIVPYEGAATGIGGNVRDVSCMGAEVIAVADTLRFGDIYHPKTQWIDHYVVAGIAGYANPIGVPNLAGDLYYDSGYQDNCLVTVITLGIVREDHLIHSYAPQEATDYALVLVGKPTDRSGFGGASFASLKLNEEDTEQNKGAVQEPNAFLGCHLLKANLALVKKFADRNLIDCVGCKDLGAGGIACASVEIADGADYGAEIYLEQVHISDKHLPPQVILCSETQERYLWVVPPEVVAMVLSHYNDEWQLPVVSRGAKASVIGKIRADGKYKVSYAGEVLVCAKAKDITKGIVYDRPHIQPLRSAPEIRSANLPLSTQLINLLKNENAASRKPIEECYDKQVQGRVILERGEAQAGVMAPFNSEGYPPEIREVGIALAVAHHPPYGKLCAYWTGYNAVVASMRKVVAVGAKPAAITDCLCFGNPEDPEQMHELIQAIQGIAAACRQLPLYDHPQSPTPVISGNVSLYNESEKGPIPASPIISCLGTLENVGLLTTPHFKQPGSILLVVGKLSQEVLPKPDGPTVAKELSAIIDLVRMKCLLSCETVDVLGLGFALMTMSFKHGIGFKLSSSAYKDQLLFSPSGAFVLEVAADNQDLVTQWLDNRGIYFNVIGSTIAEPYLNFNTTTLNLDEARQIYLTHLRELRS